MTPGQATNLARIITNETGYTGYVHVAYRPTGTNPDEPDVCEVVLQELTDTSVNDVLTIDDRSLEIATLFVSLSRRVDLDEFLNQIRAGQCVPGPGLQVNASTADARPEHAARTT